MYHDQDDSYNNDYRLHGLWIDAGEWALSHNLNPNSPGIVERYQKILIRGKAALVASEQYA